MIDKLNNQINHTLSKSGFYKNKFCVNYLPLNNIDEFNCLPFTTKKELLDDQFCFPPFGSNICVKIDDIKRIHKTSGTTNKPLILALTDYDILSTVDIGSKCFISSGLTKQDIVIHCLNYNMWSGGYTDHQSLEKTGACVIPFGVGNSHQLIETILLLNPSAIHCTPSYLKKLEFIITNDFHLKAKDLKIKLGLFGAESGLQNPEFRKNIEDTWGMKAMNSNYGMSDVLSMFGSECIHQNGLHFWGLEVLYPELIDPKTLKSLGLKSGAVGELVLTNLKKESQPVIRYRTNDIIKILSTDQCKCGYNGFIFEVVGRSDDMFVIKGINIFTSSIENILNEFHEINTGVFQILINKVEPIDKMQIKLEIKNFCTDSMSLKKRVVEKIQKDLSVTPEIELLNEGQLPRNEGKTKKLFKTL